PVNFSAALDDSFKPEETDIFETAGASPEPEPRTQSTIHVWGFIGAPGVSRATRESQHLFVNRRPVENRGLNYALLEGYHTSLMKGRYPVCCLFLELDPAAVDVNIHPAKREVKFHREFEIRKLVAQAVQETLLAFHGGESTAESKRWGERLSGRSQTKTDPREPLGKQNPTTPELPGSSAASPHQISAPALPNFPEKLRPSPAVEPPKSPGEQPPL